MTDSGVKILTINDFAEAFGAEPAEILFYCGKLIKKSDFRYKICSQEERERLFFDILSRCDEKKFSLSGPHRKPDWIKGWKEILNDFYESGLDLKSLIPKDIHAFGTRPLRYKGNYIIAESKTFELDFSLVFRHWLHSKFYKEFDTIYEFGCGTGRNLVQLQMLYPDKKYVGLDWVPESGEILTAIAKKYGWHMQGFLFDFFNPDYDIKILPNSLVYTAAALEQIGDAHDKFIDYLLTQKPQLCVNVECIPEYYEDNLFDYVASTYHTSRNYLKGYLPRLLQLEQEKRVEIIAAKRLGFGSLYHEPYSYIIWKIL